MSASLRVVHYVNQFFGGIGGEDQANVGVSVKAGAVGPGRALEAALGDGARIEATIICGDNFASDHADDAARAIGAELDRLKPDVLVAGPAFASGRYGLACALACRVAREAGHARGHRHASREPRRVERPSRDLHRPHRRELDDIHAGRARGDRAAGARRLGRERDARRPRRSRATSAAACVACATAAARAISGRSTCCSTSCTAGRSVSEVPYRAPERVTPAPPIADLSRARIAMVTTGGPRAQGQPGQAGRRPTPCATTGTRWPSSSRSRLEGVGGVPRRVLQPHRQQQPELHPAAVLPARSRAPGQGRQGPRAHVRAARREHAGGHVDAATGGASPPISRRAAWRACCSSPPEGPAIVAAQRSPRRSSGRHSGGDDLGHLQLRADHRAPTAWSAARASSTCAVIRPWARRRTTPSACAS